MWHKDILISLSFGQQAHQHLKHIQWHQRACLGEVPLVIFLCSKAGLGAQKRRMEQIHLILFFITPTSFFTALWWDTGANLGGVRRFMAGRSVQAIKAQRPANEQSVQSHWEEYSMYRSHRSTVILRGTRAVVWPCHIKGQQDSSLFYNQKIIWCCKTDLR